MVDEWVLKGASTYRLKFEGLTRPFSAGIGAVTPQADVNSDTAWCAGTRGWRHAWGLCIEGEEPGASAFEQMYSQERAIEAQATYSPEGQEEQEVHDLQLEDGDEFQVTIDATSNLLSICPPPRPPSFQPRVLTMKLESPAAPGHAATAAASSQAQQQAQTQAQLTQPFALVVALKYAGDECVLLPRHTDGDASTVRLRPTLTP